MVALTVTYELIDTVIYMIDEFSNRLSFFLSRLFQGGLQTSFIGFGQNVLNISWNSPLLLSGKI